MRYGGICKVGVLSFMTDVRCVEIRIASGTVTVVADWQTADVDLDMQRQEPLRYEDETEILASRPHLGLSMISHIITSIQVLLFLKSIIYSKVCNLNCSEIRGI